MENENKIDITTGQARKEPAKPDTVKEPTKNGSFVEADIDTLILDGVVERVVEPFKGWKVTMHSLTNAERLEVAKEIPNEEAMSVALAQEAYKLPVIAKAITRIETNGKVFIFTTSEDRIKFRKKLNNMSAVMVDVLYIKYLELTNDLITVIETGVKKN